MKVELLAPAGNYAKLKVALHFGADAVYVGGKDFSLRTYADNFTDEELASAVEYCHQRNRKLYVTVNIFARNSDFARLREYFVFLESIGADGVIVSDAGVIALAKEVAPRLPVHVSTQANLTNGYAVKFWGEMGVARVVLARELSLAEIAEIKKIAPTVELEAFAHGAMCISYSGRCLLSNYLTGRESNRGACAQSCRWQYEVRKKGAADDAWMPMEEDAKGTYILNSKDLNMIDYLPEMVQSGVCSFKIEGRMKSEYYLATVVHAYRLAIDWYEQNGWKKPLPPYIADELKNAAHRDYTQAYALGKNDETVNYTDAQSKGDCDYIANVLGYEDGFAVVEMKNRFYQGDELQLLCPNCPDATVTVGEMYDHHGNLTADAKWVQAIYRIKTDVFVEAGDILRRKKRK